LDDWSFGSLETTRRVNGILHEPLTSPARTLHTRHTTNMRAPNFILGIHFAPKIQLITFLNERGKISPLRFKVRSPCM